MAEMGASEVVTALEALASGLADGGVRMVTGYPGFHAHELVDLAGGMPSLNEHTAYAIAWGAALAGTRAAVAIKNVGLAKIASRTRAEQSSMMRQQPEPLCW
jgi:indolepyruvate ferredoxin oxidoreductase alpha subunit